MAEPSEKSPQMERDLDNMAEAAYGRKRTDSIRGNVCVTCGGEANEFRDELSRREYSISGMCQACQNSVFDAPEEEE
jgi:hypothetical protein